jgi:hypothetical protein
LKLTERLVPQTGKRFQIICGLKNFSRFAGSISGLVLPIEIAEPFERFFVAANGRVEYFVSHRLEVVAPIAVLCDFLRKPARNKGAYKKPLLRAGFRTGRVKSQKIKIH